MLLKDYDWYVELEGSGVLPEIECGLITSMKFAPKMTDKPIYTLIELVNNGVIETLKAPEYHKLWRNED